MPVAGDGAATIRTDRRRSNRAGFIDTGVTRHARATIRSDRATNRPAACSLDAVSREGHDWSEPDAAGIELLFEAVALALEPIASAFDFSASLVHLRQFVVRPGNLTPSALDQIVRILAGRALGEHARVLT